MTLFEMIYSSNKFFNTSIVNLSGETATPLFTIAP